MKNVIYKIRNVVNGNFYIGSTIDSRKRFWAHRKDLRLGVHICIHLQRAWNKYGEDCFKFEVIERLNHKDELFPAEQKLLDEHVGKDYCYNIAKYADAPMRDASPELRARIAEKTKAWIEREGHPRQGAKLSEASRKQISESRIGKHAGENHYRYGKSVSEETRRKIGDTQRGKPKAPGRTISPEGMAKIRAAAEAGHYSHWKGRKHTDESRGKMGRQVKAFLPNGDVQTFITMNEAAKVLGVPMPTIIRACKSGKTISKGTLAGWVLSYADQDPQAPKIPEEYKHLPRSRAQAKAEGASRYFTGEPCSRGHIAPRKTKGACVTCEREDQKQTNQRRKHLALSSEQQ